MCHCRSADCNKCTTMVGDNDNGEGYAWVRAGHIWEISVSSSQFCCEPKTSLKNRFSKKKKKKPNIIYLQKSTN